jgi:hypothetical protein
VHLADLAIEEDPPHLQRMKDVIHTPGRQVAQLAVTLCGVAAGALQVYQMYTERLADQFEVCMLLRMQLPPHCSWYRLLGMRA